MVFNPTKFHFAKEEVQYAGFVIGRDSIRPTDSYLQAIQDFPLPRNVSDMRSWYGLVNQVAYSFCKTPVMDPFRQLLKPKALYTWIQELADAFIEIKQVWPGMDITTEELQMCLHFTAVL